jgi:hypothetical protein
MRIILNLINFHILYSGITPDEFITDSFKSDPYLGVLFGKSLNGVDLNFINSLMYENCNNMYL